MPRKPPHPCEHPGCPELVSKGAYCERHRKAKRRADDQDRPSSSARGYDAKWRRSRRAFLKENPLCQFCKEEGYVEAATVVHHSERHGGDYETFWDRSQWVALCKSCHDKETAKGR